MQTRYTSYNSATVSRDEGLRQYMVSVYRYMGLALLLTAGSAFVTASSPQLMSLLFGTPLQYLVMFAPLIAVMWLSSRMNSMTTHQARIGFWAYAALMGLSLSSIFLIYTGISITRTFFVTASVFGAMSIYGHTTKRDLTSMGSFMVMGLMGIIIASLVNLFLHSNAVDFTISVLGVIIFTGLAAYDTQRIKDSYYYSGNSCDDGSAKLAIFGALTLYLDFINLFMQLLRLFGNRK